MVGAFNEFQRRINGVSRKPRDQEEPVLVPRKRLHGLSSEGSITVSVPIVAANGAVVGATEKRKLLIKTGLVVPPRNAQRYPFSGDQIIEAVGGTAVLQHLQKRQGKVGVEAISVDRLVGRCVRMVKDEDPVERNVSRSNKSPPNGFALFRTVVDEHADVAVIDDALVGEPFGHCDG